MTPDEIQIFYQAVDLNKAGKSKAAHHVLEGLLPNNPGNPQLLMWLIYTSTEQAQGRTYLTRLAVAKPEPSADDIIAARNWVMSLPLAATPGSAIPSATASSGITMPLTSVQLIDRTKKKSGYGAPVTWIIELNNQRFTIVFKQGYFRHKKLFLSINNEIVPLYATHGSLVPGNKEYYQFSIGQIHCAIQLTVRTVMPFTYNLVINNQVIETGETVTVTSGTNAIPWPVYMAATFCMMFPIVFLHAGVIPAGVGGAGAGLCYTIGGSRVLNKVTQGILIILTCAVTPVVIWLIFARH